MPLIAKHRVHFGPFELDAHAGELYKHGLKLKLQGHPIQILAMLLERPGELITREEIQQKLWPSESETFVDFEHGLNTAVRKLRQALGDEAETPQYIETLPRRGYRFIAPLAEPRTVEEWTVPQAQDRGAGTREKPQHWAPGRWYKVMLASVLLIGVFVGGLNVGGMRNRLWRHSNAGRGLPTNIESLAVLPLRNISQDSDQEYFADGLTDALITDLGKLVGLRVISHTSALAYKKTAKPLPQIARELNVDAIVEGTVLRSGNRLRVTAQLLRASPEEHLWAESYERDAGEVIQLEQRLAVAIAHEVTGRLTTAAETSLTSRRVANPKAYEAYLRGRYLWNERTTKAASEAGAYYEQALREDPSFALAYSGLADYYSVGWGPWVDASLAESYARKAVALAPELAEAHASLGMATHLLGKYEEAERELKRAIELNPNCAMAHHWYAYHLLVLGRTNEALAENDRARRLDPFSLPVNYFRHFIMIALREYDQAVEELETVMAMDPEARDFHRVLARIYWIEGRGPEAIAEEREAAKLAKSTARLRDLDQVAEAYASSGLRAAQLTEARLKKKACSQGSDARVAPEPCDYFGIARQYGLLGDKDKTLYWVKQGVAGPLHNRDSHLIISLKTAPEFDCVRSDARFHDLLRSVGLPE